MSAIGIIVTASYSSLSGDSSPAVVVAGARAGGIGVLDLEFAEDLQELLSSVQSLESACGQFDLGLRYPLGRLDYFQGLFEVLTSPVKQNRGRRLAIIAAGPEGYEKTALHREISALRASGVMALVECVSLTEATLAQSCGCDGVIAKGHESRGRVSDSTSFVLAQQCLRTLTVPTWVQGGVGVHTIAALSSAGAAGVVVDSQVLLCREANVSPSVQLRLAKFDGSESILLPLPNQHHFRCVPVRRTVDHGDSNGSELSSGSAPIYDAEMISSALKDHWLLGQDVCFAQDLCSRGGGTISGVIDCLQAAAHRNVEIAANLQALSENSELARAHGTLYPIVQGAMTRVSDTAEFAEAVASAGGLPFLALSLMRGAEVEKLLADTKALLGDKPWGVGLLGFIPQELRKEQLELVDKYRPKFALIAGGRPDQARALEEAGTHCYLHVPSPLLLQSFVESGSRRFIFEGKECGGHVGPRSSFVLWESMINALLGAIRSKEEGKQFHVLFAGGVHDDLSAAMVAALAAPLTERGVKVGVLVGTAYLFTEEAVSTGAIVERFQQAALACRETVLLETGPGHAIRCIDSPYRETFDRRREHLQQENVDPNEVRQELEMMNLGRLRIASKGLSRSAGRSELTEVASEEQWQSGMYMIGQVASLHNELTTIKKLHHSISHGGSTILTSRVSTEATQDEVSAPALEGIAIVGMSCMFPQANDVEQFWQNILNRVDAITEIPASHFDWRNYYDPDPQAPDKIVSKWGGFLGDVVFDSSRYGIPPSTLNTIDPMQVLVLEAAREALNDAGYSNRNLPKERTSVLVANAGHGPITALYSLRSMLGWKLENLDETTKNSIEENLPAWTEDSFAGYLGNVTAGRVANRLDLGGINFAVDAACASSLAALYVAIADLRSGASDVVLLGAADTHNQPGDYLSFSKTHALSPQGRCKTFDASADGIVISEGIAMVVLKRLSDAERDGDRIYAVIRGIGGSSDGRDFSLTAPRAQGQMLALERAYANAGVVPTSVELVEAHGTGTVAGDRTEVEALSQVFNSAGVLPGRCAIGSVKTNIGHTKAAAGLASLIKVAKSLHHKVMPPTINVNKPSPACKFEESPFYLNTASRPWIKPSQDGLRTAALSAFGFGGTNFHALVEEYRDPFASVEKPALQAWSAELFVWRADSASALAKILTRFEKGIDGARRRLSIDSENTSSAQRELFKLAARAWNKSLESTPSKSILTIIATSVDDLAQKVASALQQLQEPSTSGFKARDVQFTVFSKTGKLAFLFPGQGSQRVDMLKDLGLHFPSIRETLETAEVALRQHLPQPLSSYIYPPNALTETDQLAQRERLNQTDVAQPAVGACDLAMLRLLERFGVRPELVAGHSYGEYVALFAAGSMTEEELLRISAERGQLLANCAASKAGSMAAVAAAEATVLAALSDIPEVAVANLNAPSQVVISGTNEGVQRALDKFKSSGVGCKKIPVSAAFHSSLMEPARLPLRAALQQIKFRPASIPVYSNITADLVPTNTKVLADHLAAHIVQPVKFAAQLQAMYQNGARIFVECGPGGVLSGLVKATLPHDDVTVITLERDTRDGLHHFLNGIASLLASGVSVDCGELFWNRLNSPADELADDVDVKAGSGLIYRVNSTRVERVTDSTKTKPGEVKTKSEKPVAAVAGKTVMPTPLPKTSGAPAALPVDASGLPGASSFGGPASKGLSCANASADELERVMQDFQQSMLQMTNKFLETQQSVMLAYLQAKGDGRPQFTTNAFALPSLPAAPSNFAMDSGTFAPMSFEPIESASGEPQASVEGPQSEECQTAQTEPAMDSSVQLMDKLLEIVSDRTGYPVDMLDPSLDLEADLGIDSIKRIEILNTFRKLLPVSVQQQLEGDLESLAGIKTLKGIGDWLQQLGDSSCPDADTSVRESAAGPTSEGECASISRAILSVQPLPPADSDLLSLPSPIVVISDEEDLIEEVVTCVRGQGTVVFSVSPSACYANAARDQHLDDGLDPVAKAIRDLRANHGAIGAVIHVMPLTVPGYVVDRSGNSGLASTLKTLFSVAKEFEPDALSNGDEQKRAFINITRLGGTFGATGVQSMSGAALVSHAGSIGFMKTMAREWGLARVKTLDFSRDDAAGFIASRAVAELAASDKAVEVGFSQGQRVHLVPVSAPLNADDSEPAIGLSSNSVVLVTGGARGITADVTIELARKYKCNFVLLGRLPGPAEQESVLTAGLESAKDIKAAIAEGLRQQGEPATIKSVQPRFEQLVKEREVRQTLKAIRDAGARVRYYCVDVTDPAAFSAFINNTYEMLGNIDVVIHGAGIIEDSLFKDKTWSSFERVFNTKVVGAETLLQSLNLDTLKYLCFFSSIVGHTGNAGQCDYSAANEVLNKLASFVNMQGKTRASALLWGPWEAGMAPLELKEAFASYGWSMIKPDAGARTFVRELDCGRSDSEVLLVGNLGEDSDSSGSAPPDSVFDSPPGVLLAGSEYSATNQQQLRLQISTKEHHYLRDHAIDGMPVMPMAGALELIAECVGALLPQFTVQKVSNMTIPSGIVFDSEDKELWFEILGQPASGGLPVTVQLVSRKPKEKVHYRCEVHLSSESNLGSSIFAPAESLTRKLKDLTITESLQQLPTPKDLYRNWLFHGPLFQGIKAVSQLGSNGVIGRVTSSSPQQCVEYPAATHWAIDPILLDSTMQLAGIWARHYFDVTVLPTGFSNVYLLQPGASGEFEGRILTANSSSIELSCDLGIFDANGQAVLIMEGLSGVGSRAFNRFAGHATVAELAR